MRFSHTLNDTIPKFYSDFTSIVEATKSSSRRLVEAICLHKEYDRLEKKKKSKFLLTETHTKKN